MPEIKHKFTGGKMNKDLDERLIPNGDYRNAMNIQVSTSEGSDVGTIQNILGNNFPDIGQEYIPEGSVCIGSIADEKNDCFYWFTTEGSFKTAFEADATASTVGLSTTVIEGVNQQGQGNPWGASYWSAPLDGLNGESTPFFDTEAYTTKRTNTIHRLTEIHNPNEEYDYKIETVFLDDAGLIVTAWRPTGESQTDLAELEFASGTDILGNAPTCLPNTSCSAFGSTVLGGYAMYGFNNNGFGYGSWSGPNPGVNTKFQLNVYDAADIKVGDTVQGIGFNPWSASLGYEPYQNFFKEDTRVTSKTLITNWVDHAGQAKEHHVITCNRPIGVTWYNAITDDIRDDIPFSPGSGLPAGSLVTHLHFDHSVLKFSDENLITGINIVDDMLFWTDNASEPKKINIPRSIKGTIPAAANHTRLINEAEGISFSSGIDIREEHITVIKKAPKAPPTITVKSGREPGLNYSGVFYTQEPGSANNSSFLNNNGTQATRDNFSGLGVGDTFRIRLEERIDQLYPFYDPANYGFNTIAGGGTGYPIEWNDAINSDVVIRHCSEVDGTSLPSIPLGVNWVIKAKIVPWSRNNFAITTPTVTDPGGIIGLKLEIVAIQGSPLVADSAVNGGTLNYVIDLFDKSEKIFEFKFPRFAYRYQYEDGELSTFSPFSQVGFLPGGYTFEPSQGYNLGMTNMAAAIDIENFLTQDMPLDVTRVDLLYKDDASPTVYLIDSLRPKDDKTIWDSTSLTYTSSWDQNKYTITEENISAALPSNQLLRSWDNVPRKALAQEVSGNRIIYGNYLQNYDLYTDIKMGINSLPSFKHSLVTHEPSDIRSIKTLREYQLGVTFLDKFGRETPVLTNPNGSFKVPKSNSTSNSRLKVGLRGVTKVPLNMTHFKFYIKETSNEYYNMAMDRYYDAEDGNVWLAFASSDRNKIDIDTFLILKKGVSSSVLVKDKARYKVLAIENEAPDFIKTAKILISDGKHKEQIDDGTGTLITNPEPLFSLSSMEGSPAQGGNSFNMNWNVFSGGTGRNLDKVLDNANAPAELYVDFHNSQTGETSSRYRIAELTADWDSALATADNFFVKIADKGFGTDINFTCNNPSDPANATHITDNIQVRIYKYQVENKPQFDGRFFVKILIDHVFDAAIKIVQDGNVEYIDTAVRDVFYLGTNAAYMAKMASLRSMWGGHSFNSYNHPSIGDETRLARYMAFFQPMNMRIAAHTALYSTVGPSQGNPSLSYQVPDGNPFSGSYIDTSSSTWYTSGSYTGSNFYTLNQLSGYAYTGTDCIGSGLALSGNCMGGYKWDVNGTWYIDGSQFYVNRYNDDFYQSPSGTGWTVKPAGSHGTGISNYGRYELSMGGIIAHPSSTGSWNIAAASRRMMGAHHDDPNAARSADGVKYATTWEGEDYFDNNGTLIFDLQEWYNNSLSGASGSVPEHTVSGFFNIQSNPGITSGSAPNDYHENQHEFSDKIFQGKKFTWAEDPNNAITEIIGNIDPFRRSRNPAAGTSTRLWSSSDSDAGWGGYGTLNNSNYYIADNELRPANFSKAFRFNTINQNGDQTIAWNPTALSDNTYHGPIPNGVKMGTSDNPVSYLAGLKIKIDSGSSNFLNTWTGYSDAWVNIDNTLGYCTNNGVPYQLTHQHFIITKVGSTVISNSNLLIRNIDGNRAYITGYHSMLAPADLPASFSVGDTLELQQACMNGMSQDAADSVNYPGNVYGKHIGAVGYTFKFQEPLEFVEGEVLPPDPAVWETEPKDDVDIDIYYEASSPIPVNLNDTTIRTALPIGTLLSTQGGWFAATQSVVNNYDNVVEVSDTFMTDASDMSVGVTPGSVVHATMPDGTVMGYSVDSFLYSSYPVANGLVLGTNVLTSNVQLNWHNCYSWGNGVESNRVRDNYNQPYISNGVIVSTTLEEYAEEHKKYGLIYSGIYNSVSGINDTNQFIAAEKITKDINPIYGSIQKLHSRSSADGDLITLCEDRILKILADKDAVFNADGNANLTASNKVLGQAIPYAGDYGISKNPESFASESYRVYFTDKVRGAVIRLSKDGITPISSYGMKDWFRDHLQKTSSIYGSYDDKKEEYNVTLVFPGTVIAEDKVNQTTVSYREDVKGWVSFKSFVPENALSAANEYYTIKNGLVWHHHVDPLTNPNNSFYNVFTRSSFEVIFNEFPAAVKSFKTLNYEGTQSKVEQVFDPNVGGLLDDGVFHNLASSDGWYVDNIKTDQDTGSMPEFINKEGKWFNYMRGEQLNINDYIASNYDSGDFAHQGIGLSLAAPIQTAIFGCTDPTAFNYDPLADFPNDPDTCIAMYYGCTSPGADNFNALANTDDGTCIWSGCTDGPTSGLMTPNGCGLGCTGAMNFNAVANLDDGSCIYCIYGCTDPTMYNYDASATCDDGTCIPFIPGCTDNYNGSVMNYNPLANIDDGTCDYPGCVEGSSADNEGAPLPAGLLALTTNGDPLLRTSTACWANYAPYNNYPFSVTLVQPYPGPSASNSYLDDINAWLGSQSLTTISYIPPCPTVDDGSCSYDGCMDDGTLGNSLYPPYPAINYDPTATVQSLANCVYCGDTLAFNYDYADLVDPLGSIDACLYCPDLQGTLVVDNPQLDSFDVTWSIPPGYNYLLPGPLSPGDSGIVTVKISWGKSSEVPPYTYGLITNPGGGTFTYSPYNFDLDPTNYPAITDNGDGTLTITVSMGQFADGVLMGAPGIAPNTEYSVAVDTFCSNNPIDAVPANTILNTNFQNSNTVSQVQITTLTPPPAPVLGCLNDPSAINFMCGPNNTGTNNPGSQVPCTGVGGPIVGGIDPANGLIVNTDDGSCVAPVYGCTDDGYCTDGSITYTGYHPCYDALYVTENSPFNGTAAQNWDPLANSDDGSCLYTGCMNPLDCNYDANYNVPCVDDNGVTNGTGGNCCGGCGDPLGLNYAGFNNSNCFSTCTYCSLMPSPPNADPLVGMGINLTPDGTTNVVNGVTYLGFNLTTSFPVGFDFSVVNQNTGLGWYEIHMKVKEVGVSGFDIPSLQIDITNPPTPGTPITINFAPWNNGGMQYFNPKIKQGVAYEFMLGSVCYSSGGGYNVGMSDNLWQGPFTY